MWYVLINYTIISLLRSLKVDHSVKCKELWSKLDHWQHKCQTGLTFLKKRTQVFETFWIYCVVLFQNTSQIRLLTFDRILSLMIMTMISLNHHFLKIHYSVSHLQLLIKFSSSLKHLSHYYYHKPFNAGQSCSTGFQTST